MICAQSTFCGSFLCLVFKVGSGLWAGGGSGQLPLLPCPRAGPVHGPSGDVENLLFITKELRNPMEEMSATRN